MADDAALPSDLVSPPTVEQELLGVRYRSAVWDADSLRALAASLADGAAELERASDTELHAAWEATLSRLSPRGGERWSHVESQLARHAGLSPEGLRAGIEVVFDGVRGSAAGALFEEGRRMREASSARPTNMSVRVAPLLVVLASNLPGLALQPLLAALVLRRPVLVKSPSAEPLFAPLFVRMLGELCPAIQSAWAAVQWVGGDHELEAPLLRFCAPVIAYGDQPAIDSLTERAAGRVIQYGPKLSLGYVTAEADLEAAAEGLARDIALFDQRGCLSVQAIFTEGPAEELANPLAQALGRLSETLPAGKIDPALAAAVQSLRSEADLLGYSRPDLPVNAGTVIVDPRPELKPSPGLRTVRLRRIDADSIEEPLRPWSGRIQGVSWAGPRRPEIEAVFGDLGVSRIADAGELQQADALWRNGGVSLLDSLGR